MVNGHHLISPVNITPSTHTKLYIQSHSCLDFLFIHKLYAFMPLPTHIYKIQNEHTFHALPGNRQKEN